MRSGAHDIHQISMPWYMYEHKICPDRLWVPPSLLFIVYWAFLLGGKAARAWSLPLINIVPRVRMNGAVPLTPVCIHGICGRQLRLFYVYRHICTLTINTQYLRPGLLSIHSFVCIHMCCSQWMDVCEMWYWELFKCHKNASLVKIGKINRHFAWRHEYSLMFPAKLILNESVVFTWNVSDF